jgi:hypothetical protein
MSCHAEGRARCADERTLPDPLGSTVLALTVAPSATISRALYVSMPASWSSVAGWKAYATIQCGTNRR